MSAVELGSKVTGASKWANEWPDTLRVDFTHFQPNVRWFSCGFFFLHIFILPFVQNRPWPRQKLKDAFFFVCFFPLFFPLLFFLCSFLDASTHFYKKVCPSVRRSVSPSLRISVRMWGNLGTISIHTHTRSRTSTHSYSHAHALTRAHEINKIAEFQ